MAEIKIYPTVFPLALGEGPTEFRIPFDVNNNNIPDEIVVHIMFTALYVDGQYAGDIGVDNPFDHPFISVSQVEVGELDEVKGLDARFTFNSDPSNPILMTSDDFLKKWNMQTKFREDLVDFKGLREVVHGTYSKSTVRSVIKWISCYNDKYKWSTRGYVLS